MKKKIKYAEFPDMNTVKDIVIFGGKKGADKPQYTFYNFDGEVEMKTFAQVNYDLTGLGQYLYKLGLRGKKVAILSENSYYWIACYFSIITGKITAVPMDPKLPDDDIIDIMIRSGCNAIYYSEDFKDTVKKMKKTDGVVIEQYIKIEDFYSMVEEGHNEVKNGVESYLEDDVLPSDLAFLVYTSGTTGKSKGVMLSQKNVAVDAIATCRAMTADRTVAFLPFNHTFSWASALFACLLLSKWGYICSNLRNLQKDMYAYHPQHITAVPLAVETIYKKIWFTARKEGKEEKLKKGIKLSNALMKIGIDVRRKLFKEILDNLGGDLEMIICGGASLDTKYEKGLYELGIQIINGYGATECSPIITCNRLSNYKLGSAGYALECNDIMIKDPDEEGIGEVYARGSNVMMGYYDEPEATAEAFDGDWFKTGDYGYMDKDGFLFLRGRKKNLIVLSNGKNVSPEEIEDKLLTVDYIKEVVVYEENGAITAEFFLDENEPDAKDRLKKDVRAINMQLPTYKQVTKTKIRDTEFPKTTTLKIKRKY